MQNQLRIWQLWYIENGLLLEKCKLVDLVVADGDGGVREWVIK